MFSLSSLYLRLNTRLKVNLTSCKPELKCLWKYYSGQNPNYYSILGLKPLATDDEIKQAYYGLSKQYHPDKNMGSETASSKILEINEAFEVLGNKDRREDYNKKMFPQASVKKKHFIYEHSEYYDPPDFQKKIFKKPISNFSYEQFLKHSKGVNKRKNKHLAMRISYDKNIGAKNQVKIIR